MPLVLVPLSFRRACEFVAEYHRHHKPPQGHKFSIGCMDGDKMVGVAIVGRPVARNLDDGFTAEVTRLCTDDTPHVASKLYAACWRACRAMGYRQLVTYTLESESGISLLGAGWHVVAQVKGQSWDHASRHREDKHPLCDKQRWEPNE